MEKVSGKLASRPALDELKSVVRENDTIVVESWSRLGRSTKDLLELMDYFEDKKVRVISLKEKFDTSTPHGRFAIGLFQLVNEFEVELTRERVNEGIEAARARGCVGGRPKISKSKIEKEIKLYDKKTHSIAAIETITKLSATK